MDAELQRLIIAVAIILVVGYGLVLLVFKSVSQQMQEHEVESRSADFSLWHAIFLLPPVIGLWIALGYFLPTFVLADSASPSNKADFSAQFGAIGSLINAIVLIFMTMQLSEQRRSTTVAIRTANRQSSEGFYFDLIRNHSESRAKVEESLLASHSGISEIASKLLATTHDEMKASQGANASIAEVTSRLKTVYCSEAQDLAGSYSTLKPIFVSCYRVLRYVRDRPELNQKEAIGLFRAHLTNAELIIVLLHASLCNFAKPDFIQLASGARLFKHLNPPSGRGDCIRFLLEQAEQS